MAQTPRKLTVKDYIVKSSREMTRELVKFTVKFEKEVGAETGGLLVEAFLRDFVGALVYQALTVVPKGQRSGKESLETTRKAFNVTKAMIQDTIGDAFSDAMLEFSGRHLDYFCEVSPVPESVNDLPC